MSERFLWEALGLAWRRYHRRLNSIVTRQGPTLSAPVSDIYGKKAPLPIITAEIDGLSITVFPEIWLQAKVKRCWP